MAGRIMRWAPLLSLLCFGVATAFGAPSPVRAADDGAAYGPQLQGFEYPWPVSHFSFTSQGEALDMAYMDVKPKAPNGGAVLLLHGKNFCAATWQDTIGVLSDAGYRVIAPDQIGFCKSTKPAHYQYTFQQLAGNTHALLASLGIGRITIVGHSTGGMLGVRYALMYPEDVDQLVLVDPIGLEDWKAKGVPWQSVDAWYAQELKTTADSIRNYERTTYYAGTWSPTIRTLGADAGGALSRSGSRHRRLEFGAARRHDLHPAGVLRVRASQSAGVADGRRQGHDGIRQVPGATRYPRHVGQLPGAGEGGGGALSARPSGRVSRFGACAANPGTRRFSHSAARWHAVACGRRRRASRSARGAVRSNNETCAAP